MASGIPGKQYVERHPWRENHSMANDNKLVKIGGLWLRQDRHGKKFLTGSLGQARVLISRTKGSSPTNREGRS
jgi:hypothetical protein